MERASDKHRREASTNHTSKPIWSPTMLPTQACNLETDLIAIEKIYLSITAFVYQLLLIFFLQNYPTLETKVEIDFLEWKNHQFDCLVVFYTCSIFKFKFGLDKGLILNFMSHLMESRNVSHLDLP